MTLQDKILRELEENKECDLSGQALADRFSVSRNAVWKAVCALKEKGYDIASVPNKGYRFKRENNLLNEQGIRAYLPTSLQKMEILVSDCVDSTNNEAKRRISEIGESGLLIAAEEQTAGRGRLGRSFYSPKKTGIYMTFAVKLNTTFRDAVAMTTMASVAVVSAIEEITGINPEIKWVNDIYLKGRKICGILTEAVSDLESRVAQSVIIGIGMNLSTVSFPEEIKKKAGALNAGNVCRNQMIAKITENLYEFASNLTNHQYMAEYRQHSMVLSKWIIFTEGDVTVEAYVDAIDEDGALLVTLKDGSKRILNSGEISVQVSSESGSKNQC